MDIPQNLYQPIPFEGFEDHDVNASRTRKDCETRFQLIKRFLFQTFGKLNGLTLIDIGSANGYFGFRFLQDGGQSIIGVEKDEEARDFSNELQEKFEMNAKFVPMLKDVNQKATFDVGLYFDLHFHEGINALPWITPRVKFLFASCSGDGNKNNQRFFEELKAFYHDVKQVGISIANRAIFICTGPKLALEATEAEAKPPAVPKEEKKLSKSEAKRIKAQTEGKGKGTSENSDPSA